MPKKNILIVDDTVANIDILVDMLDEYDVVDALCGEDALVILKEEKIDLVLLDIMMPEMDGYEVCKRIKSNEMTQDIPVIFITSKTDDDSIELAYKVGGDDYVKKPFRARELLSRVNKELQLRDLITELKVLASLDPLTELYNRRFFNDIAQHSLELARREHSPLCIIILDIDKFKSINDTYGHQIGDEVIVTLSKKFLNSQRTTDIVCRYGGEEFVILLPNTKLQQAYTMAENLRHNVEKNIINLDTHEKIHFTISLGVSQFEEKDTKIEQILKRADDALFKAKESGRNRVCSL